LTPVIILADNRLVWILLETVGIISTARFTLLGTNVTPLTVIIEIIADLICSFTGSLSITLSLRYTQLILTNKFFFTVFIHAALRSAAGQDIIAAHTADQVSDIGTIFIHTTLWIMTNIVFTCTADRSWAVVIHTTFRIMAHVIVAGAAG